MNRLFRTLKKILIKPELMSPDFYLREAMKEAKKSNCEQTHWGAVLVDWQGRVIAKGHNYVVTEEMLRHCKPCIRTDIRSCTRVEYCSSIHGEAAAIHNCLKDEGSVPPDTDLYLYGYSEKDGKSDTPILLTYYPCMSCAKIMMAYGIKRVWFYRPVAATMEEKEWLPFPRHDRDFNKVYLPDYIEGPQLWFHPGVWLGLEGHTFEIDTKEVVKLGQPRSQEV